MNSICDNGGVNSSERVLQFRKLYDSAPNSEEAKQDPLVESMADVRVEWESQNASTTAEAINSPELKAIVWNVLNETSYFKLLPITDILSQ